MYSLASFSIEFLEGRVIVETFYRVEIWNCIHVAVNRERHEEVSKPWTAKYRLSIKDLTLDLKEELQISGAESKQMITGGVLKAWQWTLMELHTKSSPPTPLNSIPTGRYKERPSCIEEVCYKAEPRRLTWHLLNCSFIECPGKKGVVASVKEFSNKMEFAYRIRLVAASRYWNYPIDSGEASPGILPVTVHCISTPHCNPWATDPEGVSL